MRYACSSLLNCLFCIVSDHFVQINVTARHDVLDQISKGSMDILSVCHGALNH